MYSLRQAAKKTGVAPSLLLHLIESGKIKPSLNMRMDATNVGPPWGRALRSWLGDEPEDVWLFTDEDVARLQKMAKKFRAWEPSKRESDYFTTSDLAAEWNLSTDTIRRLFESEPNVLKIGDSNSKHKRRYVTLRIPKAVAERVHRKLSA